MPLSKFKADLECETDRRTHKSAIAQQQAKMLTSRLAAAKQNSGGYLQASTTKASKYKKLFNKVDQKFGVDKTALKDLSKSYQGHL